MIDVGILGVGTYLPAVVRRNDWWSPSVVDGWLRRRSATPPAVPAPATPAQAAVLAAMAHQSEDPFQGAVERRVMPDGMTAVDMEEAASLAAIAEAGLDRREIDLLLVHTAVPEYLLSNTACVLHRRLGLPTDCIAMQTEAAAYTFLLQLTVARQMIAAGAAHRALLVQSTGASRLLDPSDPVSALFGDAATAVVVGPVAPGRGVRAAVHRADGRFPRTLIASVRDGRWYDDGRVVLHSADPGQARQVFLETVDRGKEVIAAVLAEAGVDAAAVDFFAVHQGTPWLRRITQEQTGLEAARTVDTFAATGYLFSASIPLCLATAAGDRLLGADDLVVLFGGGTGQTYGATVLRWGA